MTTTEQPGLDESAYQHQGGPIDYGKVIGAGYRRIFVKATESSGPAGYVNPHFGEDVNGFRQAAAAAGVAVEIGAYHMLHPEHDPAAEVGFFLGHAGPDLNMLGLDFELNPSGLPWNELADKLNAARGDIHAQRNQPLYLYVNRSWRDALAPYGFPWGDPEWLAEGGANDPAPIEQTGQGPVPGITGATDIDRWEEVVGSKLIAVVPCPADAGARLVFEDGSVWNVEGCNHFYGSYESLPANEREAPATFTTAYPWHEGDGTGYVLVHASCGEGPPPADNAPCPGLYHFGNPLKTTG